MNSKKSSAKSQKRNWVEPWIELDHIGNVGIDYIINPVLYKELLDSFTSSKDPHILYDFGCGTGSLGRDLYIRDPSHVPGLKDLPYQDILKQRSILEKYIGYEEELEFVQSGNQVFKKYFVFPKMKIIRKNLKDTLSHNQINLSKKKKKVCVSRNFLMHINNKQMNQHLNDVSSLLSTSETYIVAFLNPEYEQLKHNGTLKENHWYSYQHGTQGEYGAFRQYFRSITTYENLFSKRFSIHKKIPCYPQDTTFKKSHQRYYIPHVPMAYVYILKKK
ncbi:hypothetical protein H6776_01875 [Candidatus Nomurabacteria bacterium]|nr:hypothetical protein [Candidatus Nomurabacteria bacterium]